MPTPALRGVLECPPYATKTHHQLNMSAVAPPGARQSFFLTTNCSDSPIARRAASSVKFATRSIPAHLDAPPAVRTVCCCCTSSSSSSSSPSAYFSPFLPCLLLHRVPAAPASQEAVERQDGQGAEDVHQPGQQLHGGGEATALTSRPPDKLVQEEPRSTVCTR